MNNLNAVYCRNCGTDTGIATINKNTLEEMEYNCSVCGRSERASEGIIKIVKKDDWQGKLNYHNE